MEVHALLFTGKDAAWNRLRSGDAFSPVLLIRWLLDHLCSHFLSGSSLLPGSWRNFLLTPGHTGTEYQGEQELPEATCDERVCNSTQAHLYWREAYMGIEFLLLSNRETCLGRASAAAESKLRLNAFGRIVSLKEPEKVKGSKMTGSNLLQVFSCRFGKHRNI